MTDRQCDRTNIVVWQTVWYDRHCDVWNDRQSKDLKQIVVHWSRFSSQYFRKLSSNTVYYSFCKLLKQNQSCFKISNLYCKYLRRPIALFLQAIFNQTSPGEAPRMWGFDPFVTASFPNKMEEKVNTWRVLKTKNDRKLNEFQTLRGEKIAENIVFLWSEIKVKYVMWNFLLNSVKKCAWQWKGKKIFD